MLDTDSIDKFIEMVKGGNGKIISTRLNRPFFEKRGNPELWDYFVEVSSHLEMLPSQKIALYLETGKFEHPKCVVCGKPVRMMRTHFSKYCSNACKSAHGEVAKRISETKKKADHTLSNEKRKQTMMEKYGCEYNSQREDIHHIWTQPKLPIDSHNKLHSKEWLFEEYVNKHRSSASIAKELGCHFMTVIYACRDFGIETRKGSNFSQYEVEVRDFLDSNGIVHKDNYVGLYDDKREVDLFLEEHNVAIEINGIYWHTERYRSEDYHLKKTTEIQNGVRLIQFTDIQWCNKKEICKSIILSACKKTSLICAGDCTIETYTKTNDGLTAFFDNNHIDGFEGGSLYIVMRHKDEIVMAASIGKSRFNPNGENEILRLATKLGFEVVDGLDRIVRVYKKMSNVTLTNYVNRDICDTNYYMNNPLWERLNDTKCGYFWTNGREIISSYYVQKKTLPKWLPSYDATKTEVENMQSIGFARFYDSGNMKFRLKKV